MKKSIISLFVGLLGMGVFTTSCEDMLTPSLDRYATEFSGRDTVNFYAGILRNLQQVTEQNQLLGELRGDLVMPTDYVTDSINSIASFKHVATEGGVSGQPEDGDNSLLNRAAYYKVINQCNYYLDKVDVNTERNGDYFMRRECAQVLLIRAWTYMQLVQNYGRVPFITEPVANSTTGWESNPKAWATPDNLLDLLRTDLDRAWGYCEAQGYPNYGTLKTGLEDINHQLTLFDADVVYGDLYLLCGKSRADFEQAAEHYYNFIYKNNRTKTNISGTANVSKKRNTDPAVYEINGSGWKGAAHNVGYSFGGNEIVTGVPSAANSNFGLVLSRIPNIYGFDVHSSNSTSLNEGAAADASDDEKYSTTGYVSITPNYRVRQVEPSEAYVALNKDQVIICKNPDNVPEAEVTKETAVYPEGLYDVRMDYSAPLYRTDVGRIRFISKYGGCSSVSDEGVAMGGFTFRYLLPVYRYRTIMLHYAEALNRAGYPGHAFAVIRDGLNGSDKSNCAVYPDSVTTQIVSIDDEAKTITKQYVHGNNPGSSPTYIPVDEVVRAQDKIFITDIKATSATHTGIHQAGCGSVPSTIDFDRKYTYAHVIDKRLGEEQAVPSRTTSYTVGYPKLADEDVVTPEEEEAAVRRLEGEEGGEGGEGEGEDPEPDYSDYTEVILPAKDATESEMLAMDLILADEYALETAFEGNRYYDLMRIARHLNTFVGDEYGTKWMAWKVARRAEKGLTPYQNPSQYDATLYNYLLNQQNWYIQSPK